MVELAIRDELIISHNVHVTAHSIREAQAFLPLEDNYFLVVSRLLLLIHYVIDPQEEIV